MSKNRKIIFLSVMGIVTIIISVGFVDTTCTITHVDVTGYDEVDVKIMKQVETCTNFWSDLTTIFEK